MKRTRKKYDALLPPETGAFATKDRSVIYNKEYHCKLVYRLALLNLSEPEMCIPMDISLDTFNSWKAMKSEFKMALLAGRDQADAKVARALFRRAVGWGTLEEEVVSRKLKDPDGNERIETVVVPKRKKYPPDVAAIALWLRNRHPNKWHVNDQLTQVQIPVQVNMDLSTLSLDDLRTAQRLGVSVEQQNAVQISGNGNGDGKLVVNE